jgi:hypothetical protein
MALDRAYIQTMSEQRDKLFEMFEMKDRYTPENSALVLIDHQVGTLQFVHTMPAEETLRNAIMLAKAAKAYGMPIVLTSSQEDHLQGPIAPALQQLLLQECNNRVKRAGIVNPWGGFELQQVRLGQPAVRN